MLEPFKEFFPHIMSMGRSILVRLRVLNLEFLEVVAPALFQSSSEGMKINERIILLAKVPPNLHGG